jgi:hypothetical protein
MKNNEIDMEKVSECFACSDIPYDINLLSDIEKYKKLVQQRRDAVVRWQSKNKDKVSEYKRTYAQKNKLMALKSSTRYNINNSEKYKQYQSEYRSTKLLRRLPFFDYDILQ